MRIYQIAVWHLFLLYNCGGSANYSNTPEYDHLLATEYKNEYENSRIEKSVITEYELHNNSKTPIYTRAYEYDYIYNADRLTGKNEYEIEANGEKSLYRVTNYFENKEESIGLRDSDTISYQLKEYDPQGRLIRDVKKEVFSVPAFDFYINDNFDEMIGYDSDGNVLERSITDLTTGITRHIRSFYDTPPSLSPDTNLDVVVFSTETSGDTIITKRYLNGELEDIRKETKKENREWEFTHNTCNELIFSCETIHNGNERIEISIIPESQSVDSLFYFNDREIKSVMLSPESKVTVFTDYDSSGNVLIRKRYTKFCKMKM